METRKILIDEETLQERITELAEEISNDYQDKDLRLICILKGAVYFFADLSKKISINTKVSFMRISSYVGENSTGKIDIKLDLDEDIEGKDVLIVEDIVDSGRSLSYLKEHLQKKNPNSVKICVLLDKPDRREEENKDLVVDYVGFKIPDRFVIGYGMDLDENYRNLKEINCITKENDKKLDNDVKCIKKQLKIKKHD